MPITCLIIDDTDQEKDFESLVQLPLQKDGFDIAAIFIKTTLPEILDEELNIDKDKLTLFIKEKIDNKPVDIIATDFDLSDDAINGVDVIDIIRKMRPHTPLFMYSGKIDDAIKYIVGDHTAITTSQLIEGIKKIIGYRINDFVKRGGYPSTIIKIAKENAKSLTSTFVAKLREYPDLEFKTCYPNLSGSPLKEIANHIEKSTPEGRGFQEELVEQVIAYLIKTNEDSE